MKTITSTCPIRIVFDPARAEKWMRDSVNHDTDPVESILCDEDWGTDGKLSDDVTQDLSNLLAAFPPDVLSGPDVQIDALVDSEEYQTRITVSLATFVRLADSVTELQHLVPTHDEHLDGGDADEEFPQLARAIYAVQQIVNVGNQIIKGLYGTLGRVADGRAEYLRHGPDTPGHDTISTEVATLRAAAAVVVGYQRPLFGLLPSHLWTPDMHRDEPKP